MNATEELHSLLDYFQTAKFPEGPFKVNKYLTVISDPWPFIHKITRDINDPKASEKVKESLLVPLCEIKKCCEEGPYIPPT